MRILLSLSLIAILPLAHDGPDPLARWLFRAKDIDGNRLRSQLGPHATLDGTPRAVRDALGESLWFDGKRDRVTIAEDHRRIRKSLPTQNFTVSTWGSIETRRKWGAFVSVLQDNGEAETGWVLGYDNQNFYFGLSSVGANAKDADGDGTMTYLRGKTAYELGRLYQVVATYDGRVMSLYVNGKLDAQSRAQSGAILYPETAPVVLAGYRDADEDVLHNGRVREVAWFDSVAKPAWVAHEYTQFAKIAAADPIFDPGGAFRFLVKPYLQFVTKDAMTIMWETSHPSRGRVHYGRTGETTRVAESAREADTPKTMHEVRLEGLEAQTPYFYRVVCDLDPSAKNEPKRLESELLTFQTANHDETPFAFAVISDTQTNAAVAAKVAKMAFAQRPNFMMLPGDLVEEGPDETHWHDQFFPALGPLISRVAFFPVLGNHERNALNYYKYVSLPKPEYYYTFRYGNAQFFMIDSNKHVGPRSEQYEWLDRELAQSKATWKIVCHHHPAYSSDENDYGDMWKGKSTNGDLRVRALAKLYDKHAVDIVWNGHIHSYERTWPLRAGKYDPEGTRYLITGGGGGGLETAGPIKPHFQNNVRHGHHYCMVAVAGSVLEFKAFDLDDRLFDTLRIEKKPRRER